MGALASQDRNYTLDGLRGIAALAVCAYHLTSKLDVPGYLLIRGQIAVDFFFVISGFVLAFSKEKRLKNKSLSPTVFIAQRVARFWPMTILAVSIGLLLIGLCPSDWVVEEGVSNWEVASALSVVWLPAPTIVGRRLTFFPNDVLWSLSGELAINIIYAFIAGISTRVLIVIQIIMVTTFAVLAFPNRYVGYGFQSIDTVGLTLLRVAVSFFSGVLVYRLKSRFSTSVKIHPAWLALVLILAVYIPGGRAVWRSLLSLMYIVAIFPVVIFLAAESRQWGSSIARLLGEASFPLYAIHLPIVSVLAVYLADLPLLTKAASVPLVLIVLCVISVLIHRYLDEPAYKRLSALFTGKRLQRRFTSV